MKLNRSVWHGYTRQKEEEVTQIGEVSYAVTDSHGCGNFWVLDSRKDKMNLWECEVTA